MIRSALSFLGAVAIVATSIWAASVATELWGAVVGACVFGAPVLLAGAHLLAGEWE